jgi:hypothetical protein
MDCQGQPAENLKTLFVDIVQKKRIDAGERPALRAVFHKLHGAARGMLRMRPDLPEALRVGAFALGELPAWARFSSDTSSRATDFKSTLGVGVKLFGVPGAKLIVDSRATTMDLVMPNHDVFFVATAPDMCEFTRAGVMTATTHRIWVRIRPPRQSWAWPRVRPACWTPRIGASCRSAWAPATW